MDRDKSIKTGSESIPTQTFNGKTYYLYKGERYFSKGCKRLHAEVWKYYKGVIPKGYHVHHINGNTQDNRVENLALVEESLHLRYEGKKRFKENPEWFEDFHAKGIEAAKEWHKSEEGRKWHKEHGKKSWENREYKTKVCQECGKEYKTRHAGKSLYCHNNCKARANRRNRKQRREGV